MRSIKFSLIFILLFTAFINISSYSFNNNDEHKTKAKIFTKSDIEKITDAYIHNNLNKENPVFVDVDMDGIFDMLAFNKGNVEYYRNTGTLDKPVFVLENANYDKYEIAPAIQSGMPMPIFFADTKGKGTLDMFTVKDLGFDQTTGKNEYKVMHYSNFLKLDTGTLITIILVLVIILLLLAILIK